MSLLGSALRLSGAAIKNDILRLIGFPRALMPAENTEMILTPENCHLAEDELFMWESGGVEKWFFRIGKNIGEFSQEQLFDLTMFFDKLARRSDLPTEKKLYCKDVVKKLTAGEAVPDFDGSVRTKQLIERAKEVVSGIRLQRKRDLSLKPLSPAKLHPADHSRPDKWRKVLITGWYGTETTGDKAILGEIIHFLKEHSPACEIAITTIDRRISSRTNHEIAGLEDSELVDLDTGDDPRIIDGVDAVIIGGGPLMQSDALGFIRSIFNEANRRRKARIIFGCGIGPFHTPMMESVTADILRLSTAGFFRDEKSLEYASMLVPGKKFSSACDPAFGYFNRKRSELMLSREKDRTIIAGLLRANTGEFKAGIKKDELTELNENNARMISRMLDSVCSAEKTSARLFPMNCHWLGGDDRLFNRTVARGCDATGAIDVERRYLTLDQMIENIGACNVGLAMRYHGHVFCTALGIPFLSIDYTGKNGKVKNLIKRMSYEKWSIPWNEINSDKAANLMNELIDNRKSVSEYLKDQSKELFSVLEQTYRETFGM